MILISRFINTFLFDAVNWQLIFLRSCIISKKLMELDDVEYKSTE
jgi:hypothetical protein